MICCMYFLSFQQIIMKNEEWAEKKKYTLRNYGSPCVRTRQWSLALILLADLEMNSTTGTMIQQQQ